jgi:caffeoyl-CoA O-methyltransferase
MDHIITELTAYSETHTTPEPAIIQELVAASDAELQYIDMLSGRQVAGLLQMLIRLGGFKRILEVGTFTGYSALMMALAMPEDGELITLELNKRYERISKPFFQREPFHKMIRQIMGPALESIETLEVPFDMIFLDGDKLNYPEYYSRLLPLLRPGGMMAVDNVLWNGGVLDPKNPKSVAIHTLNEMVFNDHSVDNVLLPVRDGLNLIRKK